MVSAEEEFNAEWKGKTYPEIVRQYGAPERVESDGNGGKILVFESYDTSVYTTPGIHYGYPGASMSTSVEKSFTHFFLDGDDVCYLVRTNTLMPGGKYDNARSAVKIAAGAAFLTTFIVLMTRM